MTNNIPDKIFMQKIGELGISIQSAAHEGENLSTRLKWAELNFEESVITLSDTLYRYTLMSQNMSEAHAWIKSRKMGEEWLERNRPILSNISSAKLKIHRWDDWLNHPDQQRINTDLLSFYYNDNGFQAAVNYDVTAFVARRTKAGLEVTNISHCRDFLLEEASCYILIAKKYKSLRIYPSKDIRTFQYLRQSFIPAAIQGLELSPHFDFRAIKHTVAKKVA